MIRNKLQGSQALARSVPAPVAVPWVPAVKPTTDQRECACAEKIMCCEGYWTLWRLLTWQRRGTSTRAAASLAGGCGPPGDLVHRRQRFCCCCGVRRCVNMGVVSLDGVAWLVGCEPPISAMACLYSSGSTCAAEGAGHTGGGWARGGALQGGCHQPPSEPDAPLQCRALAWPPGRPSSAMYQAACCFAGQGCALRGAAGTSGRGWSKGGGGSSTSSHRP